MSLILFGCFFILLVFLFLSFLQFFERLIIALRSRVEQKEMARCIMLDENVRLDIYIYMSIYDVEREREQERK